LRQTLLERFAEARRQSDKLFALIRPDSLYERPIAERHRFIFYLGHLEAFDLNLLQSRLLNVRPVDAALDRLFAFGIDPVDGGLPSDQPPDWPALPEVHRYKSRVRQALDAALERAVDPGFGWDNEYDAHVVDVPAFSIGRYKVTNGEYLGFINAGGYRERSLWKEADWQWISQQNITHPAFWKPAGDDWRYRGMFDELALPLD